jgi:hypothetical protein
MPSTPIVEIVLLQKHAPSSRAIEDANQHAVALRLTWLDGANGDRQVMPAHCNQPEIGRLKPSKLETFAPLNLCGLFAIRAADLSRGRWAAPGRSDP